MVAKINFELPLLKTHATKFKMKIKLRSFGHYVLPLFLLISSIFLFCCSVKIVADLCETKNLKTQLNNSKIIQEKLTDKLKTESASFEHALDYKLQQLPSVEILSLLQTSIRNCNGISISMISADTYGMNIKGSCVDTNQLNKLADILGKSPLVASVGAPEIKDSEADNWAVFTLYIKLNSLRYAIENDVLTKQGAK